MVNSPRRPLGNAGRSIASPRRIVLSRAELSRIQDSTIILTPEQMRINKEKADAQRDVIMRKSKARKEYLIQKGEETKRKAPKSDVQLLRIAETKAKLAAAREQTEEELDSVKLLNTLGSRAAAFTIRKQQLQEKEEREEREKQYEVRLNLIMEINRLELQKKEEVEVQEKRKRRYDDQKILLKQIAHREEMRQDKQKMIDHDFLVQEAAMKKLEEDEIAKMQREQARQKQIQLEVIATNEKALALKKMKERQEYEEDQRILKYQKDKAKAEEEAEQRAIAKAAADELRIAKLRAEMQKSADTQSELDELRAKRAQEQKERDARARDREVEEKKHQTLIEMQIARKQQKRQKEIASILSQKEQEREYLANIARAEEQRQKSEEYDRQKEEERLANKEIVLGQIRAKEALRTKQRATIMAEGKAINDEFNNELASLETIRTQKIQKLRDQGVDEVYLTEMQRADMRKLQMR